MREFSSKALKSLRTAGSRSPFQSRFRGPGCCCGPEAPTSPGHCMASRTHRRHVPRSPTTFVFALASIMPGQWVSGGLSGSKHDRQGWRFPIFAAVDWRLSTANPSSPWKQLRELASPHLQPVPDFTIPATPQNGHCLRAAAAVPSCRKLAAHPMPASGLKTREPQFTSASPQEHPLTT